MNEHDEPLRTAFASLEADPEARDRMEAMVLAGFALSQRSLALEWAEMLRARPIANGLLLSAAAVVLLVATPVGALVALALQLA